MEGNINTRIPAAGHKHSNYARMIVNDLAVARYEGDIATHNTLCTLDDTRTKSINEQTDMVFLQS
jgi:hypothetical protein